jgi:hypothetical protein
MGRLLVMRLGSGFIRVSELDAGDHKGPHPSDHATPAPTDEGASQAG